MRYLRDELIEQGWEDGDDIIKAKLNSISIDDGIALDTTINSLRSSYSLYQIYKVYHQNFD